ncbi:TAXI family TRAP transporter solute-binding subunit [Kitasatospora sp. NPDC096147]|uniref:TAXI family TRAP transporter solute-binding subunit n=1 Tax=Kitasatospora sp. NPDC096147 TaxID=3364093 RepID=UPI0037F8A27E
MTWRPGAALRTAARSRLGRLAAVFLLVVGAAGGWWAASGSRDELPRGETGFATGVSKGVYDRYGILLKTYLQDTLPGVQLRLDNSEGSVENLDRVADGRDSFAIATADAVASYQKEGRERIRAIARLYDDYLQLVVPADSPVQRTADLKGKRVGIGQARSGVQLVTRRLLASAGLDAERDVQASMLGITAAADQLSKGQLDAFFWSGGLPTTALTDLSEHFPIRIVPLGDLAEAVHHVEGGGADAYRAATIPADAYPKAHPKDTAVATLAVPNLLITRDDVDRSLVQRMTKAVIDSRDRIGSEVHAAQVVDLRTAVYTDPLPLHDGASAYYRSVKP